MTKTMRELPTGLRLESGAHRPDRIMTVCVMEAVAWVAGEDWSDHPECACPVIGAFLRTLNDLMPDDQRQRLLPYVVRLVGTRSTPEVELQRAYVAADWAVRRMAPLALEAAGLTAEAQALRDLPQIVDRATATATATAAAWARVTATAAARAAEAAREAAAWDVALGCLDAMLQVTA